MMLTTLDTNILISHHRIPIKFFVNISLPLQLVIANVSAENIHVKCFRLVLQHAYISLSTLNCTENASVTFIFLRKRGRIIMKNKKCKMTIIQVNLL